MIIPIGIGCGKGVVTGLGKALGGRSYRGAVERPVHLVVGRRGPIQTACA